MSKKRKTPFEQLVSTVNTTKIEYKPVTFPMTHKEDGKFAFANGVEVDGFHELGAGYFSERLPQYKHRQFTSMVREGEWDKLAETVNLHPKQLDGEYTLAIYNGLVVGVLANYNPVDHNTLIQALVDAGLSNDLISHNMTPTHLEFFVRSDGNEIDSDDKREKNVLATMHVLNGHSGHYALRCRIVLLADGYEWENQISTDRRRHLSHVNEVVDNFKNTMETIRSLKIDDLLRGQTVETCVNIIRASVKELTVRQERLLAIVDEAECANGLEFVAILGGYSQTNGYYAAVDGMLDPLLKRVTGAAIKGPTSGLVDDAGTLTIPSAIVSVPLAI